LFDFKNGINASEPSLSKSYNKDIYKLDATDPLKYKWSLLSSGNDSSPVTTTTYPKPIQTDVLGGSSNNIFRLKTRWIIAIVVLVVAFICISIKQYKSKKSYSYQQNISSNEIE